MWVAGGSGVFVSYRREDAGDAAGRLADRLADRFGAGRVFMDVEAIEPGIDFVEAITHAVEACDVLVAVIGPGWLTARDTQGRRLDDPHDWVRVEVRTALARGVRVIPVLVRDAVMPDREDLPKDLAGLARRAALRVRHESFRDDAARLVAAVAQVLAWTDPAGNTARPAANALDGAAKTRTEVSQDNVAHAARLFHEAVNIANSITIESFKAQALSGVAEAMAATDPRRAARLSNDAERIANSITDASAKARALSAVAEAMAATDPDRAELIANSFTSNYWKALALSAVAGAVARTDPGRAARLSNDAERNAKSITDKTAAKALALSAVAGAVARTDPGRAARLSSDAERIARSIPSEFDPEMALCGMGGGVGVAGAVATTDPGHAERIANSITRESFKTKALHNVAEATAATEPRRAERIANSITEASARARALSDVAGAMAATDPGRAERIANSITDAPAKARALARIAKAFISG